MITTENFISLTNGKAPFSALYSIMPIENIPSIIKHGILSHELACKYNHKSVALEDVQNKREIKIINARKLHSYANLYFDSHNPMLSKLRDLNESICILAIKPEIMNTSGTIVTDRNAASNIVQFVDTVEMTKVLNFDKIYMKYWTNDENPYVVNENKQIKCAEVLIPDCVPFDFIIGAITYNNPVKDKLLELGFNKTIQVDDKRFF